MTSDERDVCLFIDEHDSQTGAVNMPCLCEIVPDSNNLEEAICRLAGSIRSWELVLQAELFFFFLWVGVFCIYVYTHIYFVIYLFPSAYICIHMHTCGCIYIFHMVHSHIRTYINRYVCIYAYVHVYKHT